MTAREEFNLMLNSCTHPRTVYAAFLRFASTLAKEKPDNPRASLLTIVKGGEQT